MTRWAPFAALLVFLASPVPSYAQQFRANITGTVIDPQGGVVPGVTVTALNTETNVATEAVTNDRGVYSLQQLTPGQYRVSATLSGFKTFVREGITLHTAETVTVNVTLATGAVEETVTVSAQKREDNQLKVTISIQVLGE